MTITQGAKWIGGLFVVALTLLVASIFVADRQLEPPFAFVELGPIAIPAAAPLADGLVLFNSNPNGNHEIYASAGGDAALVQLTNDAAYDSWRPRLSPDRTTVLFYRSPAGSYDRDESQATLWMMEASGDQAVQVLPMQSHGWLSHSHAEWAPSGQELVMVGSRPEGKHLWITSVDGRDIRSVANEPGDNTEPSWSPDGKRVIYSGCPQASCSPEQREIYVVLAGGGDRTQLTSNGLPDGQPYFSPDGAQIVMRTQEQAPDEDGDNAVFSIRVMPTNRSELPRIIEGSIGASNAPRWQSDDQLIFEFDGDVLTASVTGEPLLTPVLQTGAIEAYPAS